MVEQPVLIVHGPSDASAVAMALAHVGWGRGRQAIPGGKPTATGRPIPVGHDADGTLVVAAGRGADGVTAGAVLRTLFGLAGLSGYVQLRAVETGDFSPVSDLANDVPPIVYTVNGPVCGAAAAAALHVGQIGTDRLPAWRSLRDLIELPDTGPGQPVALGADAAGRPVYALNSGTQHHLLRNLVRRTCRLLLSGPLPLHVVDTTPALLGMWPLYGRLLVQSIRSVSWPLAAWALRRAHRKLAGIVADTQRELARRDSGGRLPNHNGEPGAAVDPGSTFSHTWGREWQP